MITIGLDIGGSTTKVVGFKGKQLLEMARVTASDPIASAYGGVGRFLNQNGLNIGDIKEIMMTGVGSGYIGGDLLQIPTRSADEFDAVGLGGLYLSDCKEAVVVSMGTGTSFVSADSTGGNHIIGSGVGGGTLMGLSEAILHFRDIELLSELAEHGDLAKVDLTIGDIAAHEIPGLTDSVTASNFGKLSADAEKDDLALGIINLVFQSVGTAAVLAARTVNKNRIVFVGSLTGNKEGCEVLKSFSDLYKMQIIIPEKAEYATAIGAALSSLTDERHRW